MRQGFNCGLGIATILLAVFLIGCGSNNPAPNTAPAASVVTTTNVSISDPPTCAGPAGPYAHVYVTISDVQINASSTASDSDASWIDLTPSLKTSPQQVDLLGAANSQCFLAMLGSTTQLQPGTYQQIRIILAPNTATITGNNCGTAGVNCVVLAAAPATPKILQLSSEAVTGIKIPAGQIAGGQFIVAAGQTKDLNIDFDACASIVVQGNGAYRLKPVLHAGEVSATSSAINGKLVDSVTKAAITGVKGIAALEQKDGSGVDRVVLQTTIDSTGDFVFCPVPAGVYDVVVVALNGAGGSYAATITTGVAPGAALGNIPMVAVTGINTAPATLQGQVTTASAASAATAADMAISALQSIASGSGTLLVTIPLAQQLGSTMTVTTAAGAACPLNTDCASYTLAVPGANPNTGAFATTGASYSQATGAVNYTIGAQAFVPSSAGIADCTPSSLTTSSNNLGAPLTVTPGATSSAATLGFTACQ